MKKLVDSGSYVVLCLALALMTLGCQSSLDRPEFDPQWSADKAIEQCDKNGDGQIDSTETDAAPGLKYVFALWDTSRDKMISKQEIVDRIAGYRDSGSSIVPVSFTVTYQKKPLANAEVTFEPEPFMGEAFKPISATTDSSGYVSLDRPSDEENEYPGIYLGLYRVRISKQEGAKELIPAKYNSETTLGYDSGAKGRSARANPSFHLK